MKPLILLLLLTACAPAPLMTAIESTPDLSCTFLPIVTDGSIQPPGCEGIPNIIQLHYSLENQSEKYTVVDCLGVQKNWEQTIVRNKIVEIEGLNRQHLAIAREGMFEGWLQVLIWEGSEDPYILNLMMEE